MNKLVKLFAIALCVLSINTVSAQSTAQFGHIESNKLMSLMPEMKTAQDILKKDAAEFDTQMKSMQAETQKLYDAFQKAETTMSEIIKETKVKEIQDAQQRIQSFQQYAQKALQQKKEDSMKPIIEKANAAIKLVGEEKGLIYIFDLSAGNILYHSNKSLDILPFVKKKLGIQ